MTGGSARVRAEVGVGEAVDICTRCDNIAGYALDPVDDGRDGRLERGVTGGELVKL